LLLLAGTVLLNGCALNGGSSSSAKAVLSSTGSKGFSGIVHGGQNAVIGATVILWAAGTTGTYGTGATKIASTTTDATGSFSLNNSSGVSPCTTGQYLYLTATGGNSGAGTNNYIAMMAALPTPCSATTGATTVFIDEVTTIAAVTALQQFMSINTTATPPYTGSGTVPWTIGAPSTNVVGMANAFSITPLLGSITTGYTGSSFPANTITPNNSTTPQLFTTTVAPETTKINGLANILAGCINDITGNNCTGSAGVLTLTTIATGATTPTYSVPVDTIQAAYNMATLPNPALYQGAKYWKNSTSSATYLSTLWANNTPTAPFQTYLANAPSDTTVTLSWKCAGATSSTTGTVYAASVAIDGLGNVWIGGGSGVTSNYLTEFMPNGLILQDIITASTPSYTLTFTSNAPAATNTGSTTANATQVLGYGRPLWSLAIDTNNNAYFNATGATSPGTVATEAVGVMVQASQPTVTPITGVVTAAGTATGYDVGSVNGSMVIDNSNNIFYAAQHGTGRYYLGMLSQASSYQSDYEGIGRGSAIYNGVAMDSNGYAWGFGSTCTAPTAADTIQRSNAAGIIATTTGVSAADVTLASNCAYQGAGDANGNMWSTDGTNLDYINIASSITAPTVSVAYTGGVGSGLNTVNALAVDGNGNVWAANKGTTTVAGSGGVAEFATNGTAGTATLLSPTGTATAPLNGFGSTSGVYQGAPQAVALDRSGNVWYATTAGSFLYVTVGIAAPIKTPLSAYYAAIGTKP
jgi:hypothetical protein